jgi:hypothetical protein
MRSLLICCLFIATMFTNGFSASILPFDFTEKVQKLDNVGIITAYGVGTFTFYPNGEVKKIKCRQPKDDVCFTLNDAAPNNNLNTYVNGSISGTYTAGMYISHVINAQGEDVYEW